ncbi:MAG: hypothetical protein CMC36_00010 [Flavobacteriaceae bacterium]|nr:hypothetical protein [Flavobacteriaceae bacterium]|tara:strand:- start:5820 stop:6296 length:477 start_codon:yes stop_codon:yes gene_type:complete
MKKIIFALLFIFFSSCSDDTSNNTPEFQALLNGDTEWITDDFNATISNDQLTIFGINGLGSINLNVYSPEIGEFNFYGNSSSSAIFQDDSLQYSTENFVPGSIGFHREGKLFITELSSEKKIISGHFHFDAFDFSGTITTNISQGIFYRIPFTFANQD